MRYVFPDSDPEWVQPSRLANWDALSKACRVWPTFVPMEDRPHVLVLSNSDRAGPIWPIEDDRCPALTLGIELTSRGWVPEHRLVEHRNVEDRAYDSRRCTRMRWYYRVLLTDLARCLELAGGRVPPQEPMNFYRCLLAGIAAAPGLSAVMYTSLFNIANRIGRLTGILTSSDLFLILYIQ